MYINVYKAFSRTSTSISWRGIRQFAFYSAIEGDISRCCCHTTETVSIHGMWDNLHVSHSCDCRRIGTRDLMLNIHVVSRALRIPDRVRARTRDCLALRCFGLSSKLKCYFFMMHLFQCRITSFCVPFPSSDSGNTNRFYVSHGGVISFYAVRVMWPPQRCTNKTYNVFVLLYSDKQINEESVQLVSRQNARHRVR